MFKKIFNNKGISVIEIIVVISVIAIALVGLLGAIAFSVNFSFRAKEAIRADLLAQEAIEAIRSFRNGTTWDSDGLGILNTGESNPYYPELNTISDPPQWMLSSGAETIDGFSRRVIFENVSRSPADGAIEETYNPFNNDPDTRKVTAIISWPNSQIEIITYFTNWK